MVPEFAPGWLGGLGTKTQGPKELLGYAGHAVDSNFIIARLDVAILILGSIVAFIAGKWIVGASVLVLAFALGLFVAFMERWDRSRRGVSKSQDS